MRNDARTMLRFELAVNIHRLLGKRRGEVIAMLESCGIPARDVPRETAIWREGPVVHLERFVRHEGDGPILVNDDGTGARVEPLSITPDRIPEWIPMD
jgi:hypothetical protein